MIERVSLTCLAASLCLAALPVDSCAVAAQAPPAPPLRAATPARAPLLREGSHLRQVQGTVHLDQESGWWRLVLDPRAGTPAPLFGLILLPSGRLDEIRQVLEAAPGQEARFEMSGQIFVYRGRNFLMPTHTTHLAEFTGRPATGGPATGQPSAEAPGEPQPEPAAAPPGGPEPVLPAAEDEGDRVEDIMRELAEAVGPLRRSPATAGVEAPVEEASLPRDGAPLLSRRGRLSQADSGAWVFVLDADAEGLADPPLTVLPCLLLERLERHGRSTGRTAPLLLSGEVYRYDGRAFVLPTLYQIPTERTVLTP